MQAQDCVIQAASTSRVIEVLDLADMDLSENHARVCYAVFEAKLVYPI